MCRVSSRPAGGGIMGLALVWLLPLSRRSAGSAPGVPLVNELAAEFPPELPPGVFAHVGDGVRLGVGFGLGAGEAVPAGATVLYRLEDETEDKAIAIRRLTAYEALLYRWMNTPMEGTRRTPGAPDNQPLR